MEIIFITIHYFQSNYKLNFSYKHGQKILGLRPVYITSWCTCCHRAAVLTHFAKEGGSTSCKPNAVCRSDTVISIQIEM